MNNLLTIIKSGEEGKLMEKLADIEHQRWADWQKYVNSEASYNTETQDFVLPYRLIMAWQKQIITPYSDLSEKEKDSDREQVRRYLPIILSQQKKLLQGVVKIVKELKIQGVLGNKHTIACHYKRRGCDCGLLEKLIHNQALQEIEERLNNTIKEL